MIRLVLHVIKIELYKFPLIDILRIGNLHFTRNITYMFKTYYYQINALSSKLGANLKDVLLICPT